MDKTLPLPPPLEKSVPVEVFKAELTAWAGRLGVAPVLVTVRAMKRKWGSCSREGRLTFDRDLLYQPASFRARVIIHELLHIKYPAPHHGKKFQALVNSYLARYGLVE